MMPGAPAKSDVAAKPAPVPVDEAPDVPGFRTWNGVYWFVFVSFVVVVAALALFARVFA
jgi:hypothetical protein